MSTYRNTKRSDRRQTLERKAIRRVKYATTAAI